MDDREMQDLIQELKDRVDQLEEVVQGADPKKYPIQLVQLGQRIALVHDATTRLHWQIIQDLISWHTSEEIRDNFVSTEGGGDGDG